MPARIESEGVDMAIRLCMHDTAICFGERPARSEEVKRLGEYVVVYEARINRKQTHEQYDVPPAVSCQLKILTRYQRGALEELAEDLPKICARPLAFVVDHPQCREEDDRPVSNVTEHDREQEREGDHGKEARVDLLVRRDTVRIHDCLEALRKLVRSMERRRCPVRAQLMQDRRHGGARFLLHTKKKKNLASRSYPVNRRSRWRDGAPAGS